MTADDSVMDEDISPEQVLHNEVIEITSLN
jgi:hypothetical protein